MSPDLTLVTGPPPDSASIPDFVEAMSALASGVVLVTCRVGDRPWGTTVTAFASGSADPPTVLVSLAATATGARAIEATGAFGVSILAADQIPVARHGSAPGAPKFLEPFADGARSAAPAVAGALAHLDCELTESLDVADHVLLVGRVRAARSLHAGPPLLYHRRAYRTLAEPARARPSTERNARCLST
jgi:flavin reductase (DIM6/NTAB) family NADH-FMN oxidoreductase RutF